MSETQLTNVDAKKEVTSSGGAGGGTGGERGKHGQSFNQEDPKDRISGHPPK